MIAGIRRRTQRFMSLAMREAMKSSMKFRHGAVLAKGGKVVGVGHNHNRTCFKGLSVTSVHAEIEALDGKSLNTTSGMLAGDFTAPDACRPTQGSDLFIVRISDKGIGDSEPCRDCLETLKAFKVKRVFYSTPVGTKMAKVDRMLGYDKPSLTLRDTFSKEPAVITTPIPP